VPSNLFRANLLPFGTEQLHPRNQANKREHQQHYSRTNKTPNNERGGGTIPPIGPRPPARPQRTLWACCELFFFFEIGLL
jgi:hypothetical protein